MTYLLGINFYSGNQRTLESVLASFKTKRQIKRNIFTGPMWVSWLKMFEFFTSKFKFGHHFSFFI